MPKKFTDLTLKPTAAPTDLVAIVDVSTSSSKRTTVAGLADAVAVSIPASSITFAQTDGKTWWEELGRTTLGTAGDTISVTVAVRKYLTIIVNLVPSGAIAPWIRFNADGANNYSFRYSISYAAGTNIVSTDGITIDPSGTGTKTMAIFNVENILFTEKLVSGQAVNPGTAGAANIGAAIDVFGKWANTTNNITAVSVVNKGAGDFAVGSEVIVLGHN